MKNPNRGASSPSFAALREMARVYRVFLQQTLFVWPTRYGSSLAVNSSLDKFWNRERLGEIFEQCVHELKAQLGPAYQKLFSLESERLSEEAEVIVEAVPFKEITDTLDAWAPEWSQEFILEKTPVHCATLFQVHTATDENGQRWQIKVLKPSARSKMESSLNALREIEMALKPFRKVKMASKFLDELDRISRTLARSADLNIERRVLLRLKNKMAGDTKTSLRLPRIHERLCSEAVLVYEAMEGQPLDPEKFQADRLDPSRRLLLARHNLQASLLKAFEIGLIRSRADTSKLVLMKDGSIAVSRGWAAVVPDGTDRLQAAKLLRALYANDFAALTELLAKKQRLTKTMGDRTDSSSEDWQQKFKSTFRSSTTSTLVERASFAVLECEAAGIELPHGFIDSAKLLQSFEGVGKDLVPMSHSVPFISGLTRSTVSHDFAVNTQFSRARRIHRR